MDSNTPRIVPHPTTPGHWSILVNGSHYGCYANQAQALAFATSCIHQRTEVA